MGRTGWIEWGLDISDDGKIVTVHRASCPTGISCREEPGIYNTVR